VEMGEDSPNQGRAICPRTGLGLLVIWDEEGVVYCHWRLRGVVTQTLVEVAVA
jgi:hypothetical protein